MSFDRTIPAPNLTTGRVDFQNAPIVDAGLLNSGQADKIECRATARADLAQQVEQLFRKQQVWGSSPQVGSDRSRGCKPKWRNRQTRYVQGVVRVTSWEFKSPLRHREPVAP